MRPPEWDCDGSTVCLADVHVHGCFSDEGRCDDPADHGFLL